MAEMDFTQGGKDREFSTRGDGTSGREGSAGHGMNASTEFGPGRYVGVGKIAKRLGVDAQQLRSCAQSNGIIPDKHQYSCDMFSPDKAHQIVEACASGFKLG
jgi:hypothetical protein